MPGGYAGAGQKSEAWGSLRNRAGSCTSLRSIAASAFNACNSSSVQPNLRREFSTVKKQNYELQQRCRRLGTSVRRDLAPLKGFLGSIPKNNESLIKIRSDLGLNGAVQILSILGSLVCGQSLHLASCSSAPVMVSWISSNL